MMTAAGIEYQTLVRTTPPISASCVLAEAMVVSEIGARLSPNRAPETRAPAMIAGLAPTSTPTGKSTGKETTLVPTEVPVDMDSTQQITKLMAAKVLPLMPERIIRWASVEINPLDETSLPLIAAMMIATEITAKIGRVRPCSAASPYAVKSLANGTPAIIAAKKARQ